MARAEEPSPMPRPPWEASRAARLAGPVLFAAVLLATTLGLAGAGLPARIGPAAGVVAALNSALGGFITPALYLLAGLGWGRVWVAVLAGGSGSRVALQLGLGVGFMLWLSHALGVVGLISEQGVLGPSGARVGAWAPVAAGLVLLLAQVARGEFRPERWPVFPVSLALWAPALGVMLIAACNPPGALWGSEFGAYDALSYHLQLAKEWAAGPAGRIWPGDHNVYSFLPSYVEAAFAHLGMLSLGGGRAVDRMLGETSHWPYACQLLHLGFAVVGAVVVARLVRVLAERAGAGPRGALLAGVLGAAVLLGTPWTVVVGSLAYNELAMLAMMGAALLAVVDGGERPWGRGAAAGFLVGIACSAKPTALMLVAPTVGLAMLVFESRRGRGPLVAACTSGAAAGLAAIAPWLARNALASGGNPVFPFGARLLGMGHWTAEQVGRHAAVHGPPAVGWGRRLGLLVSGHGLSADEAARGLAHSQWAHVPVMAVVALAVVIAWRPTRVVGLVLAGGLVLQVIGWAGFTHAQSRFLLPMLVPMSVAIGLACAAVMTLASRRAAAGGGAVRPARAAAVVLALLPLTCAGWSLLNFQSQGGGVPNRLLIPGSAGLSGMLWDSTLAEAKPEQREKFLEEVAPAPYVNLAMRPDASRRPVGGASGRGPGSVYLLGDAAALYYLEALGPGRSGSSAEPAGVVYHTTWDASPLGEAIGQDPDPTDGPAAWSRALRARGIGFVLINWPELVRLVEKDRYYDPRITRALVERWVAAPGSGLRSIKRWAPPGGGERTGAVWCELFRIDDPDTPKPGESGR